MSCFICWICAPWTIELVPKASYINCKLIQKHVGIRLSFKAKRRFFFQFFFCKKFLLKGAWSRLSEIPCTKNLFFDVKLAHTRLISLEQDDSREHPYFRRSTRLSEFGVASVRILLKMVVVPSRLCLMKTFMYISCVFLLLL